MGIMTTSSQVTGIETRARTHTPCASTVREEVAGICRPQEFRHTYISEDGGWLRQRSACPHACPIAHPASRLLLNPNSCSQRRTEERGGGGEEEVGERCLCFRLSEREGGTDDRRWMSRFLGVCLLLALPPRSALPPPGLEL